MATSQCVLKVFLYVISFSYKDTCHIGLGPILMTLFNLNYPFKEHISKYNHILSYWGLGLQYVNLAYNSWGRAFTGSPHSCWQ